MKEKVLKATHEGTVKIGDSTLYCAVLEDGTRVFTQADFLLAIGRARWVGGSSKVHTELPPFLSANSIKPFIDKELISTSKRIIFKSKKGGGFKGNAYGYKAELLPKVCDVFLQARDAGALKAIQMHIARKCEILLRGFAAVGIIALVDEATGYQEVRDRDELNRILEAYITKELLPWAKTFPDEFYKEMFRLRGWQYSPFSVRRPGYVGKLTNQLVYEKLPPGVLDELRQKNPVIKSGRRRHKFFQYLTEDIGHPHLGKHLASVITLMRISSNWRKFESNFAKAFPEGPVQQELFEDEEDE